eukprot:4089273-Amphidinium_carterae.1
MHVNLVETPLCREHYLQTVTCTTHAFTTHVLHKRCMQAKPDITIGEEAVNKTTVLWASVDALKTQHLLPSSVYIGYAFA